MDDRELDLLVAELETENRMMRARNERLEKELNAIQADRDGLQDALARILEVSRVALWNGVPKRTEEVGPKARAKEHND
jgi:hypothetical protein